MGTNVQRLLILSALGIASLEAPVQTFGQASARDDVVSAVGAFHAALAAGDSVTLADDVVILESGGIEDKEHYRSGHLAGDMLFAQAVLSEPGDSLILAAATLAIWAATRSSRRAPAMIGRTVG
jgi:hypothetical protein